MSTISALIGVRFFYWETRLSLINGVSGYGTKVLRNVAIREGHSEPG